MTAKEKATCYSQDSHTSPAARTPEPRTFAAVVTISPLDVNPFLHVFGLVVAGVVICQKKVVFFDFYPNIT
jgi:hypothetical protein